MTTQRIFLYLFALFFKLYSFFLFLFIQTCHSLQKEISGQDAEGYFITFFCHKNENKNYGKIQNLLWNEAGTIMYTTISFSEMISTTDHVSGKYSYFISTHIAINYVILVSTINSITNHNINNNHCSTLKIDSFFTLLVAISIGIKRRSTLSPFVPPQVV